MMVDGPLKTLGVMFSRHPDSAEATLVRNLALAAAGRRIRVLLFLMAEGAELIGTPVLGELTSLGVRVSVCTQSVTERGLPLDLEAVDYSSQFQLGRLVASSDRFISFA
jgi:sulfur relay (sulfurtransferase) complex TusBCD TusD component (DsrE family)